MSAVASRPTSIANSFYDSEGRPSIEHAHLAESANNKTRGLVRAIGREREGLVPSFRPPSSWTQRSSHYHVVWNGDQDHEQFSDDESWDGDNATSSHAANNGELDATASVYGHVRPNSIASSIFAGRGAKSERRRREAPPPLPALPPSHHLLGSDAPALLSPSAQNMLSPHSDASGFESSSQHSDYDAKAGPADHGNLADGFDIQHISSSKPSSRQSHSDQIAKDTAAQPVPFRNSSKPKPPLAAKAASRGSNESPRRDGSTHDADTSPGRASGALKTRPKRLPDGTLIPKMPPVPQTTDIARSLKPKSRRDRSPILSFDGGVAEEEKLLTELQGKIADDARRISTLGPKVKKNAPAPWELGGDDTVTAPGRPSLRETLRPSAETFEKPFSRFKTRPSVDGSHPAAPRSPNPVYAPSGLANGSHAASLESEAQKEDDVQSLFASQRSRSKSVSGTAVGMLKGLGLAGAAAPASKKGKLTKALRLVGGGGGGAAHDERRSAHQASAPLSELGASAKLNHAGSSPIRASTSGNDLPHSNSTRHINGSGTMPSDSKSQANLVNMIMSSNTKFRDQACSPPLPSPKPTGATMPSPHFGGVRSLSYKKDTLDSTSFSSELNLHSMERARSRTPPMRQVSVASRSITSTEDTALRSSSVEGEADLDSIPAEGESTPIGKASAETSSALRARPTSPSSHHAGIMSASSSQTSSSLPLPGNIEGVPYKLISLEEAREQARQKQSEWLASSGAATAARTSPYLASGDAAAHDELGMQRDPSSDGGQSSMRLLKNKKGGFLLRKLKKEKGVSVDFDSVSTFPTSGSNRDLARSSKSSAMPSFSVTGLDEENDELKPLTSIEKPALQIRPVSSMFSGFVADFLDASALAEGHTRETSSSASVGSTGLLVPHSPAAQSFRTPSPVLSESGRHASGSSFNNKPKLADIRPPPHGAAVPGPTVPGSADSSWSGLGGASGASRLPSLDAGASTSDTQSQFHSPANSPLTPSFHHSVHAPSSSSHSATTPLIEETTAFSPPASPQIPEEVRQRVRDIEAQIQELCNELNELRVKHVGQGTAPVFKGNGEAEDGETRKEHGSAVVGECPACGCGCAEQRRLQSINEAAVLKGISVLDRGRALKPSANMGSTGKFGGYTNR